jgi:hypothetical protein
VTRLLRLLFPGIIFAILGLITFAADKSSWFHIRGGLTTIGLYALVLQIVLSALLVSAIDDLSGGGPALLRRRPSRGAGGLVDISARPISFSRALVEFYQRPFMPVLLFGFGLAASLSALAVGFFQEPSLAYDLVGGSFGIHRSEAAMGAVLVLGALLLLSHRGRGYFGWVIGVTLATVIGQIVFVPDTNDRRTIAGWGSLMVGLCLLRLIVLGLVRLSRGGSSPDRLNDGPGRRDGPDAGLPAVSPPGQAAVYHDESR